MLEAITCCSLTSAELRTLLAIVRRTNGFQKDEDEISYSQLSAFTGLSRRTITNCLKQLKLVNIITLVKKGDSKKTSNLWRINRKVSTWQLGKRIALGKFPVPTRAISGKQLGQVSSHTKESITKENIQKKDTIHTQAEARFTIDDYLKQVISYKKSITGKTPDFKKNNKLIAGFNARMKEGYTEEHFAVAVKNAFDSEFHEKENYRFLTPLFFTRSDKLEQWVNAGPNYLSEKKK